MKAYVDLLRLHFFFVWPVLFCSGLFLGFQFYSGFSVVLVVQAALIGFFGFEAGLVLNDIVDSSIDKKEGEDKKLTKYWRVFGKRPLSEGLISRNNAVALFLLFVAITSVLIFTLPLPHSLYIFGIMWVCYGLECFYQFRKRRQSYPFSQLIGRIDFTLFPVAGFLVIGSPDINALLFALFFYPLAQAHLGINDIADVENDKAKGLKTIPILYGMKGTAYWILIFSILHIISAIAFLVVLGNVAIFGFAISFVLISIANFQIMKNKSSDAGMKALPLFHLSMLIYAITLILEFFI